MAANDPSDAPLKPARNLHNQRSMGSLLLGLPYEQLIAVARLVMAAFAYVAIFLDQTQPARYANETYLVLGLYLALAIFLVLFSANRLMRTRDEVLVHIADILVFSILMHFTDGPTSPFFVFFTFALIAATLRWGWRATSATALALVLMLLLLAHFDDNVVTDHNELNRLIIRGAYLLVAGAMLAYVGAIRQLHRNRLSKLANWPHEEAAGPEKHPPIAKLLRHAADVIGVERALVVWDDGSPTGRWIAHCTPDDCNFAQWESLEPPADTPVFLKGVAFVAVSGDTQRIVLKSGAVDAHRRPLSAELVSAYGVRSCCCGPFQGQRVSGWLLVLDPPMTEELFDLTEIAAARIGAELEQFILRAELTHSAVAGERARLARNMHDGILQDLAAVEIQMGELTRAATPAMAGRLREMTAMLAEQQRLIRDVVSEADPKPAPREVNLDAQLRDFTRRLCKQWNCSIELTVVPDTLQVPISMAAELSLLVAEATANAVRHGGAKSLSIAFKKEAAGLTVVIGDVGSPGTELEFAL